MADGTRQVRVESDVAEMLQRAADREGVSLSHAANRWLRKGLGMNPSQVRAAASAGPPLTGSTRATARASTGGACRHPVGRRIGDHCGQCGAQVRR